MRVKFYEESEGQTSANRLIFVIGSFWVMLMCSIFAIKGIEINSIATFFAETFVPLAGLKVGQKFFEGKPTQDNTPIDPPVDDSKKDV